VQSVRLERIRALLGRPLRSLSSRILFSVFAAALVSSLVVTWVSTSTIESFLRAKIDRNFPAILRDNEERLLRWYSQCEVDLETFARSATVVDAVVGMRSEGGAVEDERALAQYLDYVLRSFEQFESLFVLAPDGELLFEVGGDVALTDRERRALARVGSTRVGDLSEVGDRRAQVASTAITQDGRKLASLHARLRVGLLERVLGWDDLGTGADLYVVSPAGEVLLRSSGAEVRERYARPVPEPGALPSMDDYIDAEGESIVGSALHFPRFGWTLVVEQPYDEAFAPVVATVREVLGLNLGVVLVFALIALQMARSVVRPVRALSEAARRISRGEVDVEIEGRPTEDDIGILTRTFNEMAARLQGDQKVLEEQRLEIESANSQLVAQNQELQRMNEVFRQLSITDELTRLHNHRFFRDHLPLEIKRAQRTGEPLCLVLIDLDDFKQLNDRFGHAVGDAVLRKVADVMLASIRDIDLLARYGGEEFALLASQTSLEGAVVVAEKIRMAISRARFSVVDLEGPSQVEITASFGVSVFRGDEKAFFNDADSALYRAKAAGKDCVVVAEDAAGRPPGES